MIQCHRKHLESRCRFRGYTLDDVRACIVAEDGDTITVDMDHPAYPRETKPGFEPPPIVRELVKSSGPGTELHNILERWLRIKVTPDCPCKRHMRQMNAWGADECERRIEEIVGWLREESGRRGLPFLDAAGRMVVKAAIRRSRAKVAT